jgi:hypothetical protein
MNPSTMSAKTPQSAGHKEFRWESVTAISSLGLAAAALLALVFSWHQVSDFRTAERVHQLVEQKRFFNSPEFRHVRKSLGLQRLDAKGKLLPMKGNEAPQEMYDVLNYFEEIGLLEKKGYLDAEDVWNQLGDWAFNFNEDGKSVIEYERLEDPYAYRNFERLVAILQQIETVKTGKPRHPSIQDLEGFYQYSQKLSTGIRPAK